jgi:hypothetical protein
VKLNKSIPDDENRRFLFPANFEKWSNWLAYLFCPQLAGDMGLLFGRTANPSKF